MSAPPQPASQRDPGDAHEQPRRRQQPPRGEGRRWRGRARARADLAFQIAPVERAGARRVTADAVDTERGPTLPRRAARSPEWDGRIRRRGSRRVGRCRGHGWCVRRRVRARRYTGRAGRLGRCDGRCDGRCRSRRARWERNAHPGCTNVSRRAAEATTRTCLCRGAAAHARADLADPAALHPYAHLCRGAAAALLRAGLAGTAALQPSQARLCRGAAARDRAGLAGHTRRTARRHAVDD